MASPLTRGRAVREPGRLESRLDFDGLWTRFRHARTFRGGIATPSGEGHEWTGVEERYCDHHADCGAPQLAELLGTTPRDVIDHMGALGVDVPPIPLLGEVCPSCGRRMPVRGRARESGICDACHTRLMYELRTAKGAEDRNRREADVEAHVRHRGAVDSEWSYAPWRDDGVER